MSCILTWPEGNRVAMLLYVFIEQWEGAIGAGHHDGPLLPPVALAAGVPDRMGESFQRYVGNCGVWRILDVLERYGVKVSAAFSQLAVENFPDAVRAYHRSGHEIVGHGRAQDVRSWQLDKAAERQCIRDSAAAIERVTGERPCGWFSPGALASANTAQLLVEEGFAWHGDGVDEDLPYVSHLPGGPIVTIPFQFDVNDKGLWAKNGLPPTAFVEIFERKLDYLERQADARPGLMIASVHAMLFGRPMGIWALEDVLAIASRRSVWFATGSQLAQWCLANGHMRTSSTQGHSVADDGAPV